MSANVQVALAVLALQFLTAHTLVCAPCKGATCIPPPPSCQRGRRPCSCCEECRVKLGGVCGPFSPECNVELICLTPVGAYIGRPPYWVSVKGRCVRPSLGGPTGTPGTPPVPTLPGTAKVIG